MILPVLPLLLGLFVSVQCGKFPPSEYEECSNATIGGKPIDIAEAPWIASISIREKAKCGGVIYDLSHVITAGKCVDGYLNRAVRVRVGSTTRSKGVTEVEVCNITVHEKFSPQSINYNLAMLKLCTPLKESKRIKPAVLATETPADGTQISNFGWPSLRWWLLYWRECLEEDAHNLQKAEVAMYGQTECTRKWPRKKVSPRKTITEKMICTEKAAKGTCSFDMGTPLVHNGKVIGILTRGGCTKRPDVYTNLVKHKHWIEKNVE